MAEEWKTAGGYAEYIRRIEIDSLWGGRKHIVWDLDRHVNILSGVNGVGKSTIINRVVRGLSQGCGLAGSLPAGVKVDVEPAGAGAIRYDIIRSFDRPLVSREIAGKVDLRLATELDLQLFSLQRRYLDYQVNLGNRTIAALQSGNPAEVAAAAGHGRPKKLFQDMVDSLFADTAKTIVRTENEIAFRQAGERLEPYQLSSGEKQMLVILLTVLVEDGLPHTLFMDEPEVSLHIDWQKRLISLIRELNPAAQIILTTHSPAVIMDGWMDRVTEVSDITDR